MWLAVASAWLSKQPITSLLLFVVIQSLILSISGWCWHISVVLTESEMTQRSDGYRRLQESNSPDLSNANDAVIHWIISPVGATWWLKLSVFYLKLCSSFRTLYCAKGNYDFGISRVIKSLEPYNKKVSHLILLWVFFDAQTPNL